MSFNPTPPCTLLLGLLVKCEIAMDSPLRLQQLLQLLQLPFILCS